MPPCVEPTKRCCNQPGEEKKCGRSREAKPVPKSSETRVLVQFTPRGGQPRAGLTASGRGCLKTGPWAENFLARSARARRTTRILVNIKSETRRKIQHGSTHVKATSCRDVAAWTARSGPERSAVIPPLIGQFS